MIILRTLTHGITSHASRRFTEWVGAYPLIALGYALSLEPAAFQQSQSFAVLLSWATQNTWSILLLLVGAERLFALMVNGSFPWFPYTPLIRNIASWSALVFWTLMWNGVYLAWRDGDGLITGVVMYSLPILLELRNVYVSRYDMVALGRKY